MSAFSNLKNKRHPNNRNSRRLKHDNSSPHKTELVVLSIIRCLSVPWGQMLAKHNKCLEQTLDHKKKVRVSVYLQFVLFSLPLIWGVQYKQESHVSPT